MRGHDRTWFEVRGRGGCRLAAGYDPEAYRLAASRLGVVPEECLVIEDSDIGVASARAFGAAVLRVQIT